ncbi:Stamen-specific protein FIL1 [Capsicum annuum]|uniref:Stamen-specific protein FIL1 n=1 Tax=Capsicum annuum TaxID=4072 RepID=A0A2G2ZYZ1_CAPAN|nr:Stamen-specific protein FIL1 [Capsicum annuum]KAF3645384.1 Stamen-specific protein FIL1 [Capsicum annuum]PHT87185.1 Stamen-specific protein FIL1 [Capsicum annuum]
MAPKKSVIVFIVLLAVVLQSAVIECQGQMTCSASLSNLNVCAPFVVPGLTNPNPSAECCTAIQSVDHDCFCNTLRISARLPSQCNLPPLSCTGQ